MPNKDCPIGGRLLLSDGSIAECEDHPSPNPNDHVSARYAVGWDDLTPGAFRATCPDCDGLSTRSPTSNPGRSSACGTCGGAGTVDTIPAELVGVGSVLRGGPLDTRFVITSVDSDGVYYAVLPNGHRLTPIGPDDLADWTLVRAVPPAGDTT